MIPSAARAVLIAGIAWGAFAFGAVYPWGYWPLCVGGAAVGVTGLFVGAHRSPRALAAALAATALAITLQVAPLSPSVVARMSPEAAIIQEQYHVSDVIAPPVSLSISSSRTMRALGIFAGLALLVTGGAALLSVRGATNVCSSVVVIGVLLAIAAIVQTAIGNGKALGIWAPVEGGNPFGPFVNHNHFAGWMLMAVPLSIGLLCATVSRELRRNPPVLRDRLLWLGSSAGSRVILMAAGIAVMMLSIFLTMSRSGMGAALAAAAMTVLIVWRRYRGWVRITVACVLVVIVAAVVTWVGPDQVATRFHDAITKDYTGRIGASTDALRVAERYPLVGCGLNTYSIAMLFYQRFNTEVYYSAAHNDYFQVLAEGGTLVGLPAIAAIVILVLTIRRRFEEEVSKSTFWIRAGATIGLLSIGIQEFFDFSLQIPGNAFLFAVLCAIALHRTPERRKMRLA